MTCATPHTCSDSDCPACSRLPDRRGCLWPLLGLLVGWVVIGAAAWAIWEAMP